MNFTKEYIKECDCKEIQGLREELEEGDWYASLSYSVYLMDEYQYHHSKENYIWLPTGDQLDFEIERVCRKIWKWYNWNYRTESGLDSSETKMRYYAFIVDNQERPICGDTCVIIYNPLIAKIKLLKQLLKETNG